MCQIFQRRTKLIEKAGKMPIMHGQFMKPKIVIRCLNNWEYHFKTVFSTCKFYSLFVKFDLESIFVVAK